VPEIDLPIDLAPGSSYTRRVLNDALGGRRQGGMSVSARYPVILIFSSQRGAEFGYQDGWGLDGFYHYTGEGQLGDMTFVRGNLAIRDHAKNGKLLLLFETQPDGLRRFVGPMDYVDHDTKRIPDQEGKLRDGIIFRLSPSAGEIISQPIEQTAAPQNDALRFRGSRQMALDATCEHVSADESVAKYRQRSAYVARYVLDRANGFCEVCGRPAPLGRPNGSAYLEPHHVIGLSDDGPDIGPGIG